jgi:hypothetical protein
VPGSLSMAILLGAFIIQGIVPGPDLLNPAKHLTLTFSFVWIIVITNIITVLICLMFLNQLAKITFVKGTYLIPPILLLVYLGGFAVKNSFGDMMLVLIFGALGWFMVKFDWQRPPLLLGLVLGGIAENNLFIAGRIYGYSWMWHPGVLVIAGIIAVGTLYPYVQARWRRSRKSAEQTTPDPMTAVVKTVPVPAGTRLARAAFALFIVGILGYVVYQAKFGFGAWEPRAGLFPWVVGLPSFLLALYILIQECLRSTREVKVAEYGLVLEPKVEPIVERQRTIAISGWIVGFFVAIWILGFVPASAVATFLYLKFGAGEQWLITVVLVVVCWLFFYGVFDYALQLPFPNGALFDWLPVNMASWHNIINS